jgi:hypothetical protein
MKPSDTQAMLDLDVEGIFYFIYEKKYLILHKPLLPPPLINAFY